MDKTPFTGFFAERRKEIMNWISNHRSELESFVILDDMNYGWGELNGRVVTTDPLRYGLEEENVQKALELLRTQIEFGQ
jgi:hypothetical protein